MFDTISLPDITRKSLAKIGNFAITKKTWSSYRTAEKMLDKCSKDLEIPFDLPLTNSSVLIFVDWLLRVRKVTAGTVNTYLSGIRQLHIIKGLDEPALRSGQVNLVLRGQSNLEATGKRNKDHKGRLPVTLSLLKIIKDRISKQSWPADRKFLVWAVCSIAFHGGFRIHELLAKSENIFDPDFTLLRKEAKIQECTVEGKKTRCIELKIKNPKESKAGSIVVIDVFETGGSTCPVKAFEKWIQRKSEPDPNSPLFTDKNGTPLTGTKLNKILRDILGDLIDYKKGSITTHSFRSGLASLMAEKSMTDAEIQIIGRWSSRAFERYIKLPRTERAKTAMKLRSL